MELNRFEVFSEFQINNFLTDIQIILINGSIKAHKLILAASSEFFKALLNSEDCKEVSTGKITLPSVDYDVFNYIFDFIYLRPQELELNKDLSFYVDVVEASDYLQMSEIISILDLKISSRFSFIDFCKEFDRITALPLITTKSTLQHQFIHSINNHDYSNLNSLSIVNIIKIIDNESFAIDENLLWDFCEFCLENNNDERDFGRDLRQKLIDSIRLGLLDQIHLERFYRILTENHLNWTGKSIDELQSILIDLQSSDQINQMSLFNINSFGPQNRLIKKSRSVPYLMIDETYQNQSILSKVSLSNFRTEMKLLIKIDWNDSQCYSFNNHLVVLNKDWSLDRDLGIFLNLLNNNHCTIPRWQHQLAVGNFCKFWGFSVVLIDTELYFFGGLFLTYSNVTVPSNQIFKFDFIDNKWKTVDNLHLKVACWANGTVRNSRQPNTVFISGGRSPQKYLKSFYLIDLVENVVVDYPSMPFSVTGHTMQMVNDTVVVFGGVWDRTVRNEILLFELTSSVWKLVSLVNIPDTRHIDYCLSTLDSLDNRNSITVYDLRQIDINKCSIYLHKVDISDRHQHDSVKDRNVPKLVTSFQGESSVPNSIMFVQSLMLPQETVTINCDF